MSTHLLSRREFLAASSLVPMALLTGCAAVSLPAGKALVPILSIILKIVVREGTRAVITAVSDNKSALKVDPNQLVAQAIVNDTQTGIPPTDVPILMVVTKQTNDIYFWQLTKKVKMVRLRHDNPGAIELKVVNESPLRIELWIENSIEEFDIEVEMKE